MPNVDGQMYPYTTAGKAAAKKAAAKKTAAKKTGASKRRKNNGR